MHLKADLQLIIVILLVNLLGAVIYLLFHLKKGDRRRGTVNFFFFLVFPAVGEIFMLLAHLVGLFIDMLKKQGLNMKELSFSKERMKLSQDSDVDRELDAVPIEEALIVADTQDKRESFLEVLKSDDYHEMMDQIQKAVESEDMEVAHYAATFVSDSMTRFKAREAEYRNKTLQDDGAESLTAYLKFMQENLRNETFTPNELRSYAERMTEAALKLEESGEELLSHRSVTQIAELWDELGERDELMPWLERARARIRDSLECFKFCARYYYKNGDRENLSELLNQIRLYSVQLDSEALEWIRLLRL